jgi:hypothetical protein
LYTTENPELQQKVGFSRLVMYGCFSNLLLRVC